MTPPPLPSRRSVIRTAAWSVPAITLVTAAPAMANASPGASVLMFDPGSSTGAAFGGLNWALYIRNASLMTTSVIPPASLTMTITWKTGAIFGGGVQDFGAWRSNSGLGVVEAVTWVYANEVTPGEPALLHGPDGTTQKVADTARDMPYCGPGPWIVQFDAPGFTPLVQEIGPLAPETPPSRSAAPGRGSGR